MKLERENSFPGRGKVHSAAEEENRTTTLGSGSAWLAVGLVRFSAAAKCGPSLIPKGARVFVCDARRSEGVCEERRN